MNIPDQLKEKISIANLPDSRLNVNFLEINPVKVDIEIILTMPPAVVKSLKSVTMKNLKSSLKDIKDSATRKLLKPLEKSANLLNMGNYKKEVIIICEKYGEDISDEIMALDKKLASLKSQSIIVPEKKAKKMVKQSNGEIRKKFSSFEKDILGAVENELGKRSRTWAIFKNTKASVIVRYPGHDIIKGVKKEFSQVDQAGKGFERIEIVKKNLYRKLESDEKFENLKMPKLVADIGIIIDKGVAFFLKKNPGVNKKLIYNFTDIADKKIIKLVDRLQDELKHLDARAGEGVMEYRIQFRIWERERKKLLDEFQKNTDNKFQEVWKNFVNEYNVFKNTKFKTDISLIMGSVTGPSKAKSGALTPVQIKKMLDEIEKRIAPPQGLVKKSKIIKAGLINAEKIQKDAKDIIGEKEDKKSKSEKPEEILEQVSGSGGEHGDQSQAKQIIAWIKEIDNLKSELESFKKSIKEICEDLRNIAKSAENITKKLTDKSQIAAFKKLNKQIEKNSVNSCEKLEKDTTGLLEFCKEFTKKLKKIRKNQETGIKVKTGDTDFYNKVKKLYKMIKADVQDAEDIIKKKNR